MKGIDRFPEFVTHLPEAALPFKGVTGWMIRGERSQVVFLEFSEKIDVPEHSHREQWEIVLSGSVALRVAGETRVYRAGEQFFIPAGILHSAEVQAGYRALIVFNEPDRYATR